MTEIKFHSKSEQNNNISVNFKETLINKKKEQERELVYFFYFFPLEGFEPVTSELKFSTLFLSWPLTSYRYMTYVSYI